MESESQNAAYISLRLELVEVAHGLSSTLKKLVESNIIDNDLHGYCANEILIYMIGHHLSCFPDHKERNEVFQSIIKSVSALIDGYNKNQKQRKQKAN